MFSDVMKSSYVIFSLQVSSLLYHTSHFVIVENVVFFSEAKNSDQFCFSISIIDTQKKILLLFLFSDFLIVKMMERMMIIFAQFCRFHAVNFYHFVCVDFLG